jgi:hypothetical protein
MPNVGPTIFSSGVNSQGAQELLAMPNFILHVGLQGGQAPSLINNVLPGNLVNLCFNRKEDWVGSQSST